MKNTWQTLELRDVVSIQRGYDLPETRRNPGNVPVIGSSGLTGYHDVFRAKGPGVTIGRSGSSIGEVTYSPVDYWPHNAVLFVTDFHGNDERFIYYFLKNIDFSRFNSGSAQPSLNRNHIYSLQVSVPPLNIQRRIVDIVGTFDDKIELNDRMNETLEQMAMELYRHWFVDFGPFQDEEFVESELGAIPKGWKVCSLGDVVDINERSVSVSYEHSLIEYVDISSVEVGRLQKTTTVAIEDAPSRAKRLVMDGDVIWSMVRPNRKSYLLVYQPPENMVVSTGFAVLSPRSIPSSYLFAHTTTEQFVDYLASNADGSAYPAVRAEHFSKAKVLVPPEDVLKEFDDKVAPMYRMVAMNESEKRVLTATRDHLLPGLLSGEIELSEEEERVEEVV
ncbi:hypothetical protein FY534_03435 [Alicyclobacillus sp. TC]|uniref:restriction endonuclease subunit S n=1 Tax=Alicyclobacillus sp. TC TaxID=2606450 RepID=UPI001931FE7B|nr:restriction endonuclease subunit S [Alicyclobacillus sp. TC]QRF22835.1 hypothetical protein FY534_03435 [Alicyclobacillus sp. TC]